MRAVLVSWLLDDEATSTTSLWRSGTAMQGIYSLFEGTSEIQRLVISRANGDMA
jgi:hypothetical protein